MEEIAPFKEAEEFDNVGLLVGSYDAKIFNVVVSLDLTKNVLKMAKEKKAELIVTHHPVIFNPLKKVLKSDLIYELIDSKISVVCAHTNLDKAKFGVSYLLAKELKLLDVEILKETMNFGRVGNLKQPLNFLEFVKFVSSCLKTPVRAVKTSKKIKRVAVVSGSGYFALKAAEKNADALVTGESKHNILLKAYEDDFCFVDASHFATENIFVKNLVLMLNEKFKPFGVNFFESFQQNPCCFANGEQIWD